MKKFLTAALVMMTSLATFSQAGSTLKIGYISTEELVSIMPETAKADTTLQQYRGALIQNYKDKQAALESAIEKFNIDSLKMTAAVKDVKRTELQKMFTELQGEEQRIQQQLQQRQQELIQPINKKAFDAIQAVAKDNGYTHIVEKGALLVAPPTGDILELVAKKLNVKLPPPGTEKTPQRTAPPTNN